MSLWVSFRVLLLQSNLSRGVILVFAKKRLMKGIKDETLSYMERKHVQIWLCYDITTLGGDHDSLADIASRVVYSFQHATWNTCCSLDARTVVKFTIVVCWTVLDPVT